MIPNDDSKFQSHTMNDSVAHPPKDPPQRKRLLARILVHGLRVVLFASIVLLIHWQHRKRTRDEFLPQRIAFDVAMVQEWLPEASQLGEPTERGGREILNPRGNPLGYALQTSPDANHIIGFSGPTNVLLVFDDQNLLMGTKVLKSQDTQEHLQAVVQDPEFFSSLKDHTWEELAQAPPQVDAVSGATLTSVAIWESIVHRLGGEPQPSLRFPEPLEGKDVAKLFPKAQSLGNRERTYGFSSVQDSDGNRIGSVLRTSPSADGVIGYQGPTDTVIGFDTEGKSIGLVIQETFDNEDYVDYVREDAYFQSLFAGLTVKQLAEMDLEEAGVEGVSGATMTSQTIARTLKHAAAEYEREQAATPDKNEAGVQLTRRDWGTALVLLGGLVMGFTNLRGKKWVRIPFQLVLIGYLGFINGDLVSQALLVGWAEHGIPWQKAMGLVLLSLAAVLVPIVSRQNVYCHQLCPHGAAQQLLKHRLPWQPKLPNGVTLFLSFIPVALLAVVVIVPMLSLSFSLVNLEPFDAYIFRIAGAATLAIFIVGLVASLFVPMAYCRFGCPTGALLSYLRFQGQSDRFTRKDAAAIGLLAMALLLFATKS